MPRIALALFVSFACAHAYVTVINTGFESGGISGWWNDGGGAAIVSGGAHAGSYCVKYMVGGPNGGAATHFGITSINPAFHEFYFRFWVKFGPGIPCNGCSSDGKHFWRVASWPDKGVGIGSQWDTNLLNGTHGVFFFGSDGSWTGHYESQSLTSGKWYQYAVRGRLESTPGRGDGHLVVTVDGQKYFDDHNYNIAGNWTGGFDTWMFTNYDGIANAYWFIDDALLVVGAGAYDYTDNGSNPPQLLTRIDVLPLSATVAIGGTQQFTATAFDQNGNKMAVQPAFSWTVSGGGVIDASGKFTALNRAGGPYRATASSGGITGAANVTVASSTAIRPVGAAASERNLTRLTPASLCWREGQNLDVHGRLLPKNNKAEIGKSEFSDPNRIGLRLVMTNGGSVRMIREW